MCANQTMEVMLLDGEVWWVGQVDDGMKMPIGRDGQETYQLNQGTDIRVNQAAPLLVSSGGRYIWSEHPLDIQLTEGKLMLATAMEESADAASSSTSAAGGIVLGSGYDSLQAAYMAAARRHFPASGTLPDELFFTAPQYNLWIELQYEPTQLQVIEYARQVIANGLPPGIIMIDDNWMEDYGVWRFRGDRFPDPRSMTDQLHQLGFKVMLWTCPFVSPDNAANFRYLERQGYLLRDSSGETAVRRWWNGYSAVLDCTHEDAVAWYEAELNKLMDDYGIDGFKFDAGDPHFYRSSDQSRLPCGPNGHCESWARIGRRYSLNEYRACWKNAGQPLVQRLADKNHSWHSDGLASLIPHGLTQGLIGYAFTCPDMIGGGQIADVENNPNFHLDQELFVRYAQCSALFPMMQFSTAPWRVLDDEHLRYCAEAAQLHARLGSEIVAWAKHSAVTGEPIMRHMAYVYPGLGYESIADQFMLGDTLLAAPVLEPGARSRHVEFPPGDWWGDDGSLVRGPCRLEIAAPLGRLPHYRAVAT